MNAFTVIFLHKVLERRQSNGQPMPPSQPNAAQPRSREPAGDGLGSNRPMRLRRCNLEYRHGCGKRWLEALSRFTNGEPLRRVHECVFGVLALESEPIDPRL